MSAAHFVAVPGGIEVALSRQERFMLMRALEVVEETGDDGPAARRLAPTAYPEDAEADAEFRRLVQPDLDQARSADRDLLAAAMENWGGRRTIEPGEAESWIRAIGESRLVLAAQEGAFEEGVDDAEWESRMTPLAMIRRPGLAMLMYLGALQQELAEALLHQFDERGVTP